MTGKVISITTNRFERKEEIWEENLQNFVVTENRVLKENAMTTLGLLLLTGII